MNILIYECVNTAVHIMLNARCAMRPIDWLTCLWPASLQLMMTSLTGLTSWYLLVPTVLVPTGPYWYLQSWYLLVLTGIYSPGTYWYLQSWCLLVPTGIYSPGAYWYLPSWSLQVPTAGTYSPGTTD